jgi:hypothetical protein
MAFHSRRMVMPCLSWLGIGRRIDCLNLADVREAYRARILDIMWAITFAAYEVISGQQTLPTLITIVPSQSLLAALHEGDVKRFLLSLSERIGRMELASRDTKKASRCSCWSGARRCHMPLLWQKSRVNDQSYQLGVTTSLQSTDH